MDRKLANNLLARTMWSIYDTVESTIQFVDSGGLDPITKTQKCPAEHQVQMRII